MTKRRLKRQLSLLQVVMLGTAGTIAAEIFVLTGHAAGLAGPATVLAVALAGLLSFSIALNYCELATTYPVTGGALTYVHEAWGSGLLPFLVGSLDCLSSAFYCALAAVGFAYSLSVFIPALPIVPTAITVIALFAGLNTLGVGKVGKAQVVLGGVLLGGLAVYVVAGLVAPNGFSWSTLMPDGRFFVREGLVANLAPLLGTLALIYNAYVGFEVIADDAEEAQNPSRNIPRAILLSLTLITVFYVLVSLVTLGVIPWQELAGSETALTDAVARFLPGWGVPMMAVIGIIATLTTVNTALLSATREAFTLSRLGLWPRLMSRLSRYRTPYVAVWFIGAITALVASIGLVDFISYISASGYLFVLFWSNLAMVRLRRIHPDLERPFKTPWFPFTAYLASGTCLLIIAFTSGRALLFGAALLTGLTVSYYLSRPISHLLSERIRELDATKDRILVPVANPRTAQGLARVAFTLGEASEDTSICLLTVIPATPGRTHQMTDRLLSRLNLRRRQALRRILDEARQRNAALYTKVCVAPNIADGILDEVRGNVKLVLMGWPGPLDQQGVANHPIKSVLQKARAHVAVLLDRENQQVRHILVPVGGGFHSHLAVRLAYEIGLPHHARITALHVYCDTCDSEELEDRQFHLQDVIEDALGTVPPLITTRLVQSEDVLKGVLEVANADPCDLLVIGASDEWLSRTKLFGALTDEIAEKAPCSVLLAHRHSATAMSWIRQQAKRGLALSGGSDDGKRKPD
jgi:amino acid transporter/nucleotide-binding universal stress UspA family protein